MRMGSILLSLSALLGGCVGPTCLSCPVCGDGVVETEYGEECDDGNNTSSDGCSTSCTLESDVCGNGIVEAGEECDDANAIDVDSCVMCVEAFCGDTYVVSGTEECDDGNTDDTDYCRNDCTLP